MNKKTSLLKKILILLVGLIALIAAVVALTWYSPLFIAAEPVAAIEDRLSLQAERGKQYQNTDFQMDAPKVVLDPYDMSPLSALLLFQTKESAAVTVDIVGKDKLSSFSHTFEKNTEHRLPIYGLYPGQENTVRLKAGDQTKTITIETAPLPDDFSKVIDVKNDKSKLDNQLYFMTPSSRGSYTVAYDVNGDVRWYSSVSLTWEIERLANGKLLLGTERLIAEPYYNSGLYEIDLLGKISKEYVIPGGYHHDYYEKADGNLIVAANNFGEGNKQTAEDYIVEIDHKTGEVVKSIDLTEIFPMEEGKSVEAWTHDDWFHNNSVYLDEKTNSLVLSGRHQDAVVSIDYKTEKINYIIGDSDNWSDDMQKYFLKPIGEDFEWQWQQHAASVLPNGDIMLFDNGTHRSKDEKKAIPAKKNYSRAVTYRVDKSAKTIEQVWQYGKQRGSEYFSPYISDADYLGENHMLVHSGGVSYVDGKVQNLPAPKVKADKLRSFTTEVLAGKVVYEIQVDTNNYRAEKMPLYTDKDQSLMLDQPAERLGALSQTENQLGDLPAWYTVKPARFSTEYQQRDVTLSQDSDRLILNAKFYENDSVRLLLKQGNETLSYKVPMTNQINSAAACIDTFDNSQPLGDQVKVDYYVNKTGLDGSYDIYLKRNDVVYATGQKVEF